MDETDHYIITITDPNGRQVSHEMRIPKGLNKVSALLTVLQEFYGAGRVEMKDDGSYRWIPEERQPEYGYAG